MRSPEARPHLLVSGWCAASSRRFWVRVHEPSGWGAVTGLEANATVLCKERADTALVWLDLCGYTDARIRDLDD